MLLVLNNLLTGYLDEMQEKRVEMERGTRNCKAQ